MSKRQDKIAARNAERLAFLADRKKNNMALFAAGIEIGKTLLIENMDQLDPEDVEKLKQELKENEKILEDYLKETQSAQSITKA